MRRKITYDMVKKEFDARNYILISTEYCNNSTKLQYLCPHHSTKGILEITFANFTKGRGCPYCAKRAKKTHEEYVSELGFIKPNIEVIGEYKNLRTKLLHRCKVCGYEWFVRPDNLLYLSNGCPKCGKRAVLTNKEFIERVNRVNSNIEVIGTYHNSVEKIKFGCKLCGNIWEAKPNNILNGKGCPVCSLSKGEKKIREILKSKHIIFIEQYKFKDCVDINPLPFDFFLPEHNTLIEYDGKQHYEPCTFGGIDYKQAIINFEKTKEHDKIKTEYCFCHKINLVRIPYYDYRRIEEILYQFG